MGALMAPIPPWPLVGPDRGAVFRHGADHPSWITGTPCELEFNHSLGANASFTFTAHAVYLPRPRIEIAGPQGVQATLDWMAAKATSPASHVHRHPVNTLAGY